MQDLINNFGINGYLLIAQIVNFLIVLYLLKRFAFGPILKLLEDRRKTIAESIKNAEETQRLLAQTEEKEKQVLQKAQSQAQEMLSDAKKQVGVLQQEAEIATKGRIEKMLSEATGKIQQETQLAEKQLATHVTRLSVDVLEKSLRGFFTDKEQKEVVEKAIKKINV